MSLFSKCHYTGGFCGVPVCYPATVSAYYQVGVPTYYQGVPAYQAARPQVQPQQVQQTGNVGGFRGGKG